MTQSQGSGLRVLNSLTPPTVSLQGPQLTESSVAGRGQVLSAPCSLHALSEASSPAGFAA